VRTKEASRDQSGDFRKALANTAHAGHAARVRFDQIETGSGNALWIAVVRSLFERVPAARKIYSTVVTAGDSRSEDCRRRRAPSSDIAAGAGVFGSIEAR
jgi:hypothetical protein